MKKFLSLFMVLALVFSFSACGERVLTEEEMKKFYGPNFVESTTHSEQEKYLFGMDYLAWEGIGQNIDYVKAFQVLDNMGVQSMRHWMHFAYLLKDPTTFHEGRAEMMHKILAEAKKHDIQIVGMSHSNWDIHEKQWVIGKHRYQPWEDSDYYKWLEVYEETWYTIVKEFPEITYWEIDNEINNMDFMYIHRAPKDKRGRNLILSLEQMAQISADMMFYASRGIHRANPNAITVMGGLVDPNGLGTKGCGYSYDDPEEWVNTGTMVDFLEVLYDCIATGEHGSYYPDDFFQVAAWHPYYYSKCADDFWVAENNRIYDVIKRREGKDKKVFLTEGGWSARGNTKINGEDVPITSEMVGAWIKHTFNLIATKMPYVESWHYFRMFDNIANNNSTGGLFFDPDPNDSYAAVTWIPEILDAGAPKAAAYAYQQMTGATGSLELLVKSRNK